MIVSQVYDKLKEYIDLKLSNVETALTTLFQTYKTKEVGTDINSVKTVGASITDVVTVSTNISNVNTVSTNISSVNTTGNSITDVGIVATNISNINTVAPSVTNINLLAPSVANIDTLASLLNGLSYVTIDNKLYINGTNFISNIYFNASQELVIEY